MESAQGIAPTRLRGLPSWLLGQTALRAQRLGSERFAAMGSSRAEYAVLSALDEYGPASQIELGRRCGFDRSDMVAIITALAANHLVDRRRDTADQRRNVITITAAGGRHLRRLDTVAAAIQDQLLAPLTDRERDKLRMLLQRIIDAN